MDIPQSLIEQTFKSNCILFVGDGLFAGDPSYPTDKKLAQELTSRCLYQGPILPLPRVAGRGVANPLALMRSSVLMLRHIGMREQAERLTAALRQVVVEEKILTGDLGGSANTHEFTEAVVRHLA